MKKSKKNKILLSLIFALILVIAGTAAGKHLISDNGYGDIIPTLLDNESDTQETIMEYSPLFYSGTDGNLYLMNTSSPEEKPILIGEDTSGMKNYELMKFMRDDSEAVLYSVNEDIDSYEYYTVGDLCLYEVGSKKPVVIAEKVFHYLPSADFGYIYYCKVQEEAPKKADLYLYRAGESEKVIGDVVYYFLNEKGDSVLCLTGDGDILRKKYGKAETVLVENADEIIHITEDLQEIIYHRDGKYIKRFSDGSELEITEDYEGEGFNNAQYFESGKGYFLEYDKTLTLEDILIDDMLNEDIGKNDERAYVRNRIRESVDLPGCYNNVYDLYYFDSEKKIYVGKVVKTGNLWFDDPTVICVSTMKNSKPIKVKMSELCKSFTSTQMKNAAFSETAIFEAAMKHQERKNYFLKEGRILFEFDPDADLEAYTAYDEESKTFLYSKSEGDPVTDGYNVYKLYPFSDQAGEKILSLSSEPAFCPFFKEGSFFYGVMKDKENYIFDIYKDQEIFIENVTWCRQDTYLNYGKYWVFSPEGKVCVVDGEKITAADIPYEVEDALVTFTNNGNYVVFDTEMEETQEFYILLSDGETLRITDEENLCVPETPGRISRGYFAEYLSELS